MQAVWQRELDALRAAKGKAPDADRRKAELKRLIRSPAFPAPAAATAGRGPAVVAETGQRKDFEGPTRFPKAGPA